MVRKNRKRVLAGLMALGVRSELAQPGLQYMTDIQYNELFTMHATIMIFVFVIPILAAISISQRDAALLAARMAPAGVVAVPDAPFVHVYVADGSVQLEGTGPLGTGDAARITGGAGQLVTAGPEGAELLVWEMHAGLAA